LSSPFQDFVKHYATFSFFSSLFDIHFETVPDECKLEVTVLLCDEHLKSKSGDTTLFGLILWPLYLQRKSLQYPFIRRLEGIKDRTPPKNQVFRLSMWCNRALRFLGYVFCQWVFVARNFETSSSSVGCPTLLDQYLRKLVLLRIEP
jgi:hypothetical protein